MLFSPDLQLEFLEMEDWEQFDYWQEEEEEPGENPEEIGEETAFPLPF